MLRVGCDTRSFFKRSTAGLNSKFSFSIAGCFTKAKEPPQSYYLPIVGERTNGLIPFLRILEWNEMLTAPTETQKNSEQWTETLIFFKLETLLTNTILSGSSETSFSYGVKLLSHISFHVPDVIKFLVIIFQQRKLEKSKGAGESVNIES